MASGYLGGPVLIQRIRFQLPVFIFLWFLSACGSGGVGGISAPTVTQTIPADQATNIPVDSTVSAKFASSIDPVTVNDKNFILVGTTGTVTYVDKTAIFTPSTPLQRGVKYTAILTTGIKDLDGVPMPSNFTWSFQTEGGPDTTPPTIIAKVPDNGVKGVSVNTSIRVVFSKPIDPSTINKDTFFLNIATPGTYSYDDASQTAVFTPSNSLPSSKGIIVTVTKGVKDLAGNPLADSLTWSFETSVPDQTPPKIMTRIPDQNAKDISVNTDISVTFDEEVDPPSLQSNFVLTDPAGSAVPTNFTYTVGSRTAVLRPQSDLKSQTTYQVWVKKGVKDLSGNATPSDTSWFFTTGKAPDTTPPKVVTQQPAASATGVSVRGSITATFSEPIDPNSLKGRFTVSSKDGNVAGQANYTSQSLQASFAPTSRLEYNTAYTVLLKSGITDLAGNSLADTSWTFTTIDPPTVTQMSPKGQGIATDPPPPIQVTFSREMNASSINQSSFQVTAPTGATVLGSISYAKGIATFTPTVPFSDNTIYQVTLTTDIVDPDNNPLPAQVTWTFQTAAPPDPPPKVSSTTPADGAIGVSVNTSSIFAQFVRPIDPSSLNGQFTLQETNGTCCLTGKLDYDAAQQRAIFNILQGPLAYNTSYTATLKAGVRSTSGTPMGSPYDWKFTTEAAPDTTAPTVTRTDPADKAQGVPVTDLSGQPFPIRVDFSEPIAQATVNQGTFIVVKVESDLNKPQFVGTIKFDSPSTVLFVPTSAYEHGKTYQATLKRDITDLAGNHLPSEVVWSFTTAP